MTIPMIPGPWSWLQGLGQAGEDIISAPEKKRQKEQAYGAGQAQIGGAQLGALAQLINMGADPSTLASPQNAGTFQKLGILQPTPGSIAPNVGQMKSRAQADAITAGGAQGRAVTGVPSEEVAAAGEETTKNQAALVKFQKDMLEAQMAPALVKARNDEAAQKLAEKFLKENEKFGRLAAAERLGVLSYLMQEQQNASQVEVAKIYQATQILRDTNSDEANLRAAMQTLMQQSRTLASTREAEWSRGMNQALMNAGTDPKRQQELFDQYVKLQGPKPDIGQATDEIAQQFGLTADAIHRGMNAIVAGVTKPSKSISIPGNRGGRFGGPSSTITPESTPPAATPATRVPPAVSGPPPISSMPGGARPFDPEIQDSMSATSQANRDEFGGQDVVASTYPSPDMVAQAVTLLTSGKATREQLRQAVLARKLGRDDYDRILRSAGMIP